MGGGGGGGGGDKSLIVVGLGYRVTILCQNKSLSGSNANRIIKRSIPLDLRP